MRHLHKLQPGRAESLSQRSGRYLALLDEDSYPAYLGPQADYLDLEVHLAQQREALVVVSWTVPDRPVDLRVELAYDWHPLEALAEAGERAVLDGWVRTTSGRLTLANAERLYAAARDGKSPGGRTLRGPVQSHRLEVPPGIYSVHLVRGRSDLGGKLAMKVLLRHYPFPAPRVAPVRLGSLIPWAA
jgi:hypothetical protein